MKPFVVLSLTCLVLTSSVLAAQTAPPQVYKPGQGVLSPKLLREVKPHYPPSAVSRGLHGTVLLQCVVQPDGSATDVHVVRSLDPVLDDEAVLALKQWRFIPGTKEGRPVPVMVDVEMSFATEEKGPLLDSADVFKAGPGVTLPKIVTQVRATYPDDARAAGIQGSVILDCVVLPDGSVGNVRVSKGIDSALDGQAVAALKQWRFKPGSKDGQAVPVQITVEITFAMR